MSVNNFKKDFPIFENKDIAYLDSGATTQKPTSVLEAIEKFYKNENANPHRGAYGLSIEATEIYENTRDKIAKFINAKHREEIIFSKNASFKIIKFKSFCYFFILTKIYIENESSMC